MLNIDELLLLIKWRLFLIILEKFIAASKKKKEKMNKILRRIWKKKNFEKLTVIPVGFISSVVVEETFFCPNFLNWWILLYWWMLIYFYFVTSKILYDFTGTNWICLYLGFYNKLFSYQGPQRQKEK